MKIKNLTPLTAEEYEFAARYHESIEKFLKYRRLNPDDWYDIAVFGYLKAVKLWFNRAELHIYDFEAIAYNSMRSIVGNEYRKQSTARKYETFFGLNDAIGDTDGNLTYLDMIADPFNRYEAIEEREALHERFACINPRDKAALLRKLKKYLRSINPDLREVLYAKIIGQSVY